MSIVGFIDFFYLLENRSDDSALLRNRQIVTAYQQDEGRRIAGRPQTRCLSLDFGRATAAPAKPA
jgi:hypothetical protein